MKVISSFATCCILIGLTLGSTCFSSPTDAGTDSDGGHLYPNSGIPPQTIYHISESRLSRDEIFATQILAGQLVKRQSPVGVFLDETGKYKWIEVIRSRRNVDVIEVDSFEKLLELFKDQIEGYIFSGNRPNYENALNKLVTQNSFLLAATPSTEVIFQKLGLRRVNVNIAPEKFSNRSICHKNPSDFDSLVDWAIYSGCETVWRAHGFLPTKNLPLFKRLQRPFAVYGWSSSFPLPVRVGGNTLEIPGEHNYVRTITRNGGIVHAAGGLKNLALLSTFRTSPTLAPKPYKTIQCRPNTHVLAFLVSDGDSFAYMTNHMWQQKTFPSSSHGTIPLGWTVAPAAWYLAPIVLEDIYDRATEYDSFVAGPSGIGYAYPSSMNSEALKQFASLSQSAMKLTGLDIVNQINTSLSSFTSYLHGCLWNPVPDRSHRAAEAFPFAKGIFSYSYVNYSQGAGKIEFVGQTPVITGRTKLMWPWNKEEYVDDVISDLRELPRDHKLLESYSLIPVNAWDYGLNEIQRIVNELGQDACIVTPNQMIDMVKQIQ